MYFGGGRSRWSAFGIIGGLTWYQSKSHEFEHFLYYSPPTSIKYFACWTSVIKEKLGPTCEGEC